MSNAIETGIRSIQVRLEELERQRLLLEHRLGELVEARSLEEGPPDEQGRSRRRIIDGVYLGERPSSREECIEIYRQVLSRSTGQFVLRNVMPDLFGALTGAEQLDPMRLYVNLNTDVHAPEAVIGRCLRLILHEGEESIFQPPDVTSWKEPATTEEQTNLRVRQIQAAEMVVLRRRQILVGDPGSGKTTFVHFIANALARRDAQHLTYWPAAMREHLPILLSLRDFAVWWEEEKETHKPGISLIWAYILRDLQERNLGFMDRILLDHLEKGNFLFLIDGLDEVPEDRLEIVRDSIEDCATQYPKGRFLVTCRKKFYQQCPYPFSRDTWPITRLAPFSSRQIHRFADRWYREFFGESVADTVAGEERIRQFTRLLRQPEWVESARNPLLLTLMALVYTQYGELPNGQAQLIEQTLALFLWHWEWKEGASETTLTNLFRQIGWDRNDLIRLLERLFFRICARGQDGKGTGHCGMIREKSLRKSLSKSHPKHQPEWVHQVMETLSQKSALFLRSPTKRYVLPHRCFAEYLAGVHLAHRLDYPDKALQIIDACGTWQSILLHSVRFLIHAQREIERPLQLAERLLSDQIPESELDWRRVALSGEVLKEIGLRRLHTLDTGPALLERIRKWLAVLVECGAITAQERAEVGDILGVLGDPRFETGHARLPLYFGGEHEKALGLVSINPGSLNMGSSPTDVEAEEAEKGNTKPIIINYKFWIFRYPVTVSQYQRFVEEEGYRTREWWSGSGWDWRKGTGRTEPEDWEEQLVFCNRPVVGVSWYEAVAYANWLDAYLRRKSGQVPPNYAIRLPTEAEWERAARGDGSRRYPWGERWNDEYANAQEKIGHPTAVGIFPGGATPKAVMDMAGNVFEWCQSRFQAYPYDPGDGRNDWEPTGPRVARGGSWLRDSSCSRAAFRLKCDPELSAPDIGFRLVLSKAMDIL